MAKAAKKAKRSASTSKQARGGTKKKATKSRAVARSRSPRMVDYPISDTLRWVADGEKLLVKWGAIRSPGARRIAGTVGRVLSVLEALADLRKA